MCPSATLRTGRRARSADVCLPDPSRDPQDGLPNATCRECFCPVTARRSAGQQRRFRLDLARGEASLLPAVAFPYGGVGMILSAGLVSRISSRAWAGCAAKLQCGPADFRVATCVQNLAGIGMGHIYDQAVWYDVEGFMKRALEPHFGVGSWPWSMHKVDAPTAHILWHAYRRKFQGRTHEHHRCDRTGNFVVGGAAEGVWGRFFPPSIVDQDAAEEACVAALGERSGFYQRHAANGYIMCRALLPALNATAAAAAAVLHVEHTFGAVCWSSVNSPAV